MSIRELPSRPSLEHLKNQSRTLLRQAQSSDPQAAERFAAVGVTSMPKYADALHVIAREYGFPTWASLKLHVSILAEDPMEALTAALRANDAQAVRQVLARHPSLPSRINEPLPKFGFDAPALFAAVQKGNREIVDALLDAGANINERTRWWAGGFGVLDSAGTELAAYLISRGAAVDIHAAARLGMAGKVRALLAADPSLVHARGGDGQFPLHFAADLEIATLLLDHGATVDARDIDHESTAAQYMVALKPHRHELARFLISRGAQTDILMASALGDVALIEQLLDYDPETIRMTVSEKNLPKSDSRSGGSIYLFGFGITKSPHMIAHEFGHRAAFELLMRRSPPWLRLIQAAELGDEPLVHQILSQQPALFARLSDRAARRIIGVALRNNDRAVALLLKHGWPAQATLDNHQTALHYAAWHGNLAMVRVLLEHGASVHVLETEHGGNPLAWALHGSLNSWEREKGDYVGVTTTLLASGATLTKPELPLEAADDVLEVIRQHVPVV